MKLTIIIVIQCILLSIVIIGQIKLHQQNRYLSQLEGKYLETEKIKDLFQKIIGNFYTFEGQFEQNYSGKDENGNNSNLSGLINNEQTVLIFKYKSTDCSLCIEKVYEQIQNTPLNIKILFISDFQNFTYSGAYPFTFRQPIKHKIAFKSTILYPFIP